MFGLIRAGQGRGGGASRDLRADFFRGLALWFIFIDHVPGNWLGGYTLRNVALCDATEAFVLLAGYAAGLAYGSMLDRQGWFFASAAILRRVGTLYIAHVFLFVVFTAQVGYSVAALDSVAYLDELDLNVFGEQPYRALLEALLLRFQPAFLDILPLYIVLLLMLVPALLLLHRPRLLVTAAFAAYAAVRLADVNLPSWRGGGWFLNPLAWQALFFAGCALGSSRRAGDPPRIPRSRVALLACAALLAAGALLVVAWQRPEPLPYLPDWLASVLSGVDKTSLHPFRLLSILALAYLLGHWVSRDAPWMRSPAAAPFVLMGQHGLPVFCIGIFLSFMGRIALEQSEGWPMQMAVNLAGLAAMVAVAAVGAWYRQRSGERGRKAAGDGKTALPAAAPNGTMAE
ncbi:MAG: OpgC domain-containing protein [Acetobacteraceae bacterium]|nr:OpgC domain-containing protein [Acetobacteraceae bacterium]